MVLIVKIQFTCDYAFRSQDKIKSLFGREAFKVHSMLDDNRAFGFELVVVDRDIEATKGIVG